ncbi:MAG: NlpC/P60 family protein [Kineothrix sp.]
MRRKFLSILGIGLICMAIGSFSEKASASTIEEIKRQQEANRQQLNNVEGQIDGLEGRQADVQGEINELDANVVQIIASVEMIKEDIVEKEGQIRETEAEYEAAKAREEEQYEAMKVRIKFMYEQGDRSYVQVLMSSESFGDMVNKADYIEQLYEYDRKMLEEYQAAREYVRQVWDQLEEEKAELEVSQHELEQEQAYMEQLLAEKRQEYANYNVQIARAKQEAAAYKTKIRQQTAQIKKLEEEARKKAEEEARKKAEEEARKKAAAQAAAGNTNGVTGETGSSSESEQGGSDASSESSQEGSSSENSSSAQNNSASAEVSIPSGGSSKGQEIASYACQFVGNPYVAGGTSLTEGADCSGFVWRVYKDKGYSVPRTSWTLRSAGREVAYADAQPGDIVCYAGHVGIYIGNGSIVHASTPKSGIKITTATYKPILTVRRVV